MEDTMLSINIKSGYMTSGSGKMSLLLLFAMLLLLGQAEAAFQFNVTRFAPVDSSELRPCRMAVMDNIRGFLNWHQDWFKQAAKLNNVVLADDKEKASSVDVVIFHAPTHHSTINAKLRTSFSKAIFAMVSMEQPNYATIMKNFDYINRNIDLMVTYSLASTYPNTHVPNLPISYYPSHIVPTEAILKKPKAFQEKDGFKSGISIAIFTSNCANAGAKERSKYIEELMSYVKVHSYGKCFNNVKEPEDKEEDPNWPPIAQRRARKIKVLSQYKFYLSFENSPIEDYVSEKVFEGLLAGTVPVYRGAHSIHRFMPGNDSFIDANNLSARALADMLHVYISHEKKYESFFAFKNRPIPQHFTAMTEMSYVHPKVVRRICDAAMDLRSKQKKHE